MFGFIQSISIFPFIVHLWTEASLRMFNKFAPHDVVFFDATGTIARDLLHTTGAAKKRVLYYSLIIGHPTGNSPLPVAEMISNAHDVPVLNNFLQHFLRDVHVVTGHRCIPKQIEIDFSSAMLQCVVCSACSEDIAGYLQRAWEIVNYTASKHQVQKTVIHVCSSHIMHAVQKHLRAG